MNPKPWYKSATVYSLAFSFLSHLLTWAGVSAEDSEIRELAEYLVPALGMGFDVVAGWGRARAQGPLTSKAVTPSGAGLLVACLLLAGLVLAPVPAMAQSLPATGTASWTLPTQNDDGTDIAGALALTEIEVFVATAPIPDEPTVAPNAVLSPATTTTVQTIQATATGTLYFRVRACNQFRCSLLSTEATKPIVVPAPGVPTNVTFTIVINAAAAP